VHWFSEPITRDEHPWAYTRGEPKLSIAAIELYGSLLLLKHITTHCTEVDMAIPLLTDNMGNSYRACDFKCKKWPNSAILMEMALCSPSARGELTSAMSTEKTTNGQTSSPIPVCFFRASSSSCNFITRTCNGVYYTSLASSVNRPRILTVCAPIPKESARAG
jgi:hypothetical protein